MTQKTPFLIASAREPGHLGNTEWLVRQAASPKALEADAAAIESAKRYLAG